MPTLSFNTVVAAAITVGVIAALIFGPKMMYASSEKATNFLEKYIPIPFVKPHLNEFTATPELVEGKIAMDFELALGGVPSDSVLEIYMSKASEDASATELKAPDPVYDEAHIIYSSEKLNEVKDQVGKGAVKITCPGSKGCHSAYIDDKNWVDNFEPDWYTFTAVIKGEKSVEKSASVGIYDDNYVELLNKRVASCPAKIIGIPGIVGVDQRIDTQNCNVVECKKGWMNYRVMTDLLADYQGGNPEDQIRVIQNTINSLNNELEENKNKFEGSNDDNEKKALTEKIEDLTKRIATFTNQIIALKKAAVTPTPIKLDYAAEALNKILTGIGVGSSCVASDKKTGGLNFDKCGPSEIDDFSKKFARYELFVDNIVELRNSAQDKNKVSETDYSRLSQDRLQKFFDNAVQKVMYCSRGDVDDRAQGEYAYYSPYGVLIGQGWLRKPGTTSTRRAEIEQELSKVLAGAAPAIANPKAVANNVNKNVELSWTVPIGIGADKIKAGSYKISPYYTRWDRAEAADNQRVQVSGLPDYVIQGMKDGVVETSSQTKNVPYVGKYDFEISIYSEPDAQGQKLFSIKTPATGFFNDEYVEIYKGGTDGNCITKGIGTDPVGLKECDVEAQKREELGALITPAGEDKRNRVLAALNKAADEGKLDRNRCKYAAVGLAFKHWLFDECTPEEVDLVWKYYLNNDAEYNCASFTDAETKYEAQNVCKVKRQLVTTLSSRGWADIRVNQGWENNI